MAGSVLNRPCCCFRNTASAGGRKAGKPTVQCVSNQREGNRRAVEWCLGSNTTLGSAPPPVARTQSRGFACSAWGFWRSGRCEEVLRLVRRPQQYPPIGRSPEERGQAAQHLTIMYRLTIYGRSATFAGSHATGSVLEMNVPVWRSSYSNGNERAVSATLWRTGCITKGSLTPSITKNTFYEHYSATRRHRHRRF
jgi:hypothetical protein